MVHGPWAHNTLMALTLRGKAFAQDMVTTWHFEASGTTEAGFAATGDAGRVAWATAIRDEWKANNRAAWLAGIQADYTLPTLKAQVLECPGFVDKKLTPTEVTDTTGIAGTYTASSGATTTAQAGVIRWKTLVAGKSHRGRTYVPISPPGGAGSISPLVKAVYATYATALLARFGPGGTTTSGCDMTIYSKPYTTAYLIHRDSAGVPVVVPIGPYDGNSTHITSFVVDDNMRQQRRRELGVGS